MVASSIAWPAQLRAQDASPTPAPAAVAEPASPPAASQPEASLSAATGEGALEEPSAGELPPPSAPGAATATGSERGDLDLRLRQLEDERSSAVLPWLVFGGGAGLVVASTALVAAQTLSCDSDDDSAADNGCETANWAALALVAGSAIATVGAIWIVRVGSDNAEVDLKQRSIQEDLQRLDARQQRARLSNGGSAPRVSMRWQF